MARRDSMYEYPADTANRQSNKAAYMKWLRDNGLKLCKECGAEYSEQADCTHCIIEAERSYKHFASDN